MNGIEINDPYILALIATGLFVLAGTSVYLVFYLLFKKLYGDKVRSPGKFKEELVMCGLEYTEEELTAPISRVFTDIMKRALPLVHRKIWETGGTRILNDWFTWMLIFLVIILVIVSIIGW